MIANFSFVTVLALLAAIGLAVAVLIANPTNPLMLLAWMGIALVVAIAAQISPRRI